MSREFGFQQENFVKNFLLQKKWKLLAQNFSCRWGELDLVFCDAEKTIIFVEVKYRASNSHGGAIAAVTKSKQRKMLHTAMTFIQTNHLENYSFRFDIAAVSDQKIDYIQNAFSADEGSII